jgi:hypothetical protein
LTARPEMTLPYIDEHVVTVEAERIRVWYALGEVLGGLAGPLASRGAQLLGTDPHGPHGDPLIAGSTLTGFRVVVAEPPVELALEGRHRFSRYALVFRLQAADGRTTLRAETRAVFPGPHGSVYRGLVIGTRLHVVAVRRMLRTIRRRVEREARDRP